METDGILALTLFFSGFLSVWLIGMDSENTYFLKKLCDKVNQGPKAQTWNSLIARSRFVFGGAATALCLAALLVNACTWVTSSIVRQTSLLVLLNGGIATLFLIFVGLERWRWRMGTSKKYTFALPRWSKAVFVALFIYVVSTFISDMVRSREKFDGDSLSAGKVQLEIGTEQKLENQRRRIRGFSNIWILLSSVSAVGLLLAENKETEGPFGKFNSMVERL